MKIVQLFCIFNIFFSSLMFFRSKYIFYAFLFLYLQDVDAIQHSKVRVNTPSTKVFVGSDEAAVMCLFDQALSENNYNDKLLEIVQKFQTPVISAISCEKLSECSVKVVFLT